MEEKILDERIFEEQMMELQIDRVNIMRSDVNHIFLWIFIYNISFFAFALLNPIIPDYGLLSIIAIVVGNIILFLVSRNKKYRINYFDSEKEKMTPMAFIALLCMLGLSQCISLGFTLIFYSIGIEGTDIPIELNSIWMILYACLLGPVAEELSYRGFALGGLRNLGIIPAIILSSLAFGLMHGNLSQFIMATLIGLAMGYFSCKYGHIWAIIIHLFNNFVLGGLPMILTGEAAVITDTVSSVFVFTTGAGGILILIMKRKTILEFLHDPKNAPAKGWLRATLTSVFFWVFCIFYICAIILVMLMPSIQQYMNRAIV